MCVVMVIVKDNSGCPSSRVGTLSIPGLGIPAYKLDGDQDCWTLPSARDPGRFWFSHPSEAGLGAETILGGSSPSFMSDQTTGAVLAEPVVA